MLTTLNYEGSPIQFEVIDGHVMANATSMFKVSGGRLDHWKDSESTKRYIETVTRKLGIAENQLVISKKGGLEQQGTWIHERLILNAARYISTDFEIWCDEKIAELLREGSVSLKNLSPAEMLLLQAQQLVNHERQIKELEQKQAATEAVVVEIVNNMQTRPDYFCISAFCALHGIRISNKTAQRIGKLAAAKCKSQGYEIGSVKDEKWGKVGSYPAVVLKDVFTDEGFGVSRIAA